MGNTSTKISELVAKPPLTRDELYKRTDEYRNLLNDIFYYMMNEIKINDFIQLSTAAGCKKYVLFMANNLQHFFHQMKVDITRDKHGILAFRRVSDLENPTDKAKTQKETLCTVLAYYYTRVFQIYGAIVLTTVDDVSDIIHMAEAITQPDTILDILPAPGHPRTTILESKRIFGGAIPNFGVCKFIHPFMAMMPGKNEYMRYNEYGGYLTNYRGRGQDDVVYFLPDREQLDDMGRLIKSDDFKGSGRFSIRLPETERLSYVTIHVEDDRRGHITCRWYSLSYYTKGASRSTIEYVMNGKPIYDLFKDNSIPHHITLTRSADTNQSTAIYVINDVALSVEDYFQKVFSILIPYLRKQYNGSTDKSIVEKSSMRGLELTYAVDSIKNKPQARCISRIHQLLQQEPFAGDPSGKRFVSSICENTFFTNPLDRTTSRKDIPLPGHSLSESKGLKATLELFFDTVTEATPHLVMSNESFQDYRKFMLQLVALNEGTAAMQAKAHEREITLEGIKDMRTDQHVCIEYKNKKIPLRMEQAAKLKPFIAALFKRHVEHIVKCNDLLHELFYIEYSKEDTYQKHVRISLSDNIKKGGIVEVNRIGKKVRDLIMLYFIDCDKGYLDSEDVILEMKHEEKIAEAKAKEQKRKASEQAAAQAAAARIAHTAARAAPAVQPVQPPNNAPRGLTTAALAQQAAAIGQQRLNLGQARQTTTAAQLAAQQAQQAAQDAQRRAANAITQQAALQDAVRQRVQQDKIDEEMRKRLAGMKTASRSNQATVAEGARYGATGPRERRQTVRFGQEGGKTRKRRST